MSCTPCKTQRCWWSLSEHLLPWPVVTEDSSVSWLPTLPEGRINQALICPQTPVRCLHCMRRANKDTCRLPAAVSHGRAGLRMSYSSDTCHEPQACSHSPCWDNVPASHIAGKVYPIHQAVCQPVQKYPLSFLLEGIVYWVLKVCWPLWWHFQALSCMQNTYKHSNTIKNTKSPSHYLKYHLIPRTGI